MQLHVQVIHSPRFCGSAYNTIKLYVLSKMLKQSRDLIYDRTLYVIVAVWKNYHFHGTSKPLSKSTVVAHLGIVVGDWITVAEHFHQDTITSAIQRKKCYGQNLNFVKKYICLNNLFFSLWWDKKRNVWDCMSKRKRGEGALYHCQACSFWDPSQANCPWHFFAMIPQM